MSIRRTEFEGVEGICLENDSISLVVCPSVGGKIVSFCLKDTGQELLWRNENLALRPYPEGTAYDPHFYGGIDELLPNDEKEVIDGIQYPDHGELWTTTLDCVSGQDSILLSATLPASGLRYEKKMTLSGDAGTVVMDYRITNTSSKKSHFLLKMHAALLLHEGDRIICPAKRGEIGDADFTGRHESRFFPWPDYHGERLDIVGSAQEKRSEFFFLHDLERGEMRMESPAARTFFSYSFDTGVFPYAWYFASYGGWNGLYTGVLEPATAIPCSLGKSIKDGTCSTLAPGETLCTTVTINAGRLS